MPDSKTGTLTPEKVEELSEGIVKARDSLDEARKKMDESNDKVGKLLNQQKELEQSRDEHGEELKRVNDKLGDLAEKMELVANQYTDTVNTLRTQMKTLANDGGNEELAFRLRSPAAKGAIFSCRQEALEIGMYLMATMKAENNAKTYARRWLQDHKQDLRYLPNIPKSFVEAVSNPIISRERLEQMNRAAYGETIHQDLAGGATPGSVFVRPEFASTLIRNVEEHGAFRRNALVWPMGSDTVYIPRRKSGVTFYWEGEADAGTGADPDFDLLGMTAKKGMMLHKFSSELAEDAALSIADIFMFEFALAVATEEDKIGFQGDGTSTYAGFQGVLGQTGSGTTATADSTFVPHLVTGAAGANLISEVTYGKLLEMLGKLPTWAHSNAKWYMHRTVAATLGAVETTAGNLAMQFGNQLRNPQILGIPIERVDQTPSLPVGASTNAFCLGDLRKSWALGDRRKMEVETSEHYAFNTDQIAIRLTTRISFRDLQANGMVIYKTGTA